MPAICSEENFIYLNGKKNYVLLRNNLFQYKNKIYCATQRREFHLKSTFHIVFKTYKDKKNEQLGKNLLSYENAHAKTSVFERKLKKN